MARNLRDVRLQCPYAQENVMFFAEDMIAYTLRREGIFMDIRRPPELERLRTNALVHFTPAIGNTVMVISRRHSERVLSESLHIWDYVRTLRPSVRGEVLYSSLVSMGARLYRQNNNVLTLYIIMAIIANISERAIRSDHGDVIGYCVSALEFIINNVVHGGYVRTIINITHFAMRQQIVRGVPLAYPG